MSKNRQFRKLKKLYINVVITNMRILKKEKFMTQINLNQKQQPKTNIVSTFEPVPFSPVYQPSNLYPSAYKFSRIIIPFVTS